MAGGLRKEQSFHNLGSAARIPSTSSLRKTHSNNNFNVLMNFPPPEQIFNNTNFPPSPGRKKLKKKRSKSRLNAYLTPNDSSSEDYLSIDQLDSRSSSPHRPHSATSSRRSSDQILDFTDNRTPEQTIPLTRTVSKTTEALKQRSLKENTEFEPYLAGNDTILDYLLSILVTFIRGFLFSITFFLPLMLRSYNKNRPYSSSLNSMSSTFEWILLVISIRTGPFEENNKSLLNFFYCVVFGILIGKPLELCYVCFSFWFITSSIQQVMGHLVP